MPNPQNMSLSSYLEGQQALKGRDDVVTLIVKRTPYKPTQYWGDGGWTVMIHCANQYNEERDLVDLLQTITLLNDPDAIKKDIVVFPQRHTLESILS
jgi:hypothetical protein